MLTPKDIHEVAFSRVLKGYNPREVDAFLRKIVVEYEGILQENDDLQAQIRVLEEKVYEAAALQKGIRDALAKANELVERRRVEAEDEAERILQKARHAAQLEEEHLRRIQEFGAGVKRRLRSLLMTHISLLDDEEAPSRPPRRPEPQMDLETSLKTTTPAYDHREEQLREQELASEAELEETRVFTLPTSVQSDRDRDAEMGGADHHPTAVAVGNGYDEAAPAREAGEAAHDDRYAPYDDGSYDEERELQARWQRRLRQNREGTPPGSDDDD